MEWQKAITCTVHSLHSSQEQVCSRRMLWQQHSDCSAPIQHLLPSATPANSYNVLPLDDSLMYIFNDIRWFGINELSWIQWLRHCSLFQALAWLWEMIGKACKRKMAEVWERKKRQETVSVVYLIPVFFNDIRWFGINELSWIQWLRHCSLFQALAWLWEMIGKACKRKMAEVWERKKRQETVSVVYLIPVYNITWSCMDDGMPYDSSRGLFDNIHITIHVNCLASCGRLKTWWVHSDILPSDFLTQEPVFLLHDGRMRYCI